MRVKTVRPPGEKLGFRVADGVWGLKDIMVNIYIIADPASDNWVLVDTGFKNSTSKIKKLADFLFGYQSKPAAILLTHAHFDHIGSLKELSEEWNVPIYAHYLELPYLSGVSSYPPPDPSVGGGLMSAISWTYPNKPINLHGKVDALPEGGEVPFLNDWKYIHTPGHAPGHVSFFRERDGVLIAGDAFVTTTQESLLSVVLQSKQVSGPPKYFTYDWAQARRSVIKLEKLRPWIIATGHGQPMRGLEMQRDLANLALHFYELAVPKNGRYRANPAVADVNGILYVPPERFSKARLVKQVLGIVGAVGCGFLAYNLVSRRKMI